jgi:DNA-binding beta-propeller fold protein YncE
LEALVVGGRRLRWVLVVAVVTTELAVEVAPAGADPAPPPFFTAWGTGGSGSGQFSFPWGIAADDDGNVYVTELVNNRVQKFSSTGTYLTQWGGTGTGNGQFTSPIGVAVDSDGNVYVADAGNDRVQKFTSTGTYLAQWGTAGTGNGQFSSPHGIAVDADDNVYVSESDNNRVQKFTSTGTFLTTWGTVGTGNGQFTGPLGLAVDGAGAIYVADTYNDRIQKFTSTGTYLTQWGGTGAENGQFSTPIGVAVDGAGTVYVTDSSGSRVEAFTSTGTYLFQWGDFGNGPGQFHLPAGVAVDGDDAVYVAEHFNHRVQVFGPTPPFVPDPELTATMTGPPVVMAGEAIAYELSVTNTGNEVLTGVRAVDGDIPDCEGPIGDGTVAVEAEAGRSCSAPTTADDIGAFRHWAVVTSDQHATDTTNVVRTTVAAPRPDGLIRRAGTTAYTGNGIYNATGARQSVTRAARRGSTVSFDVDVTNDSAAADSFTLRGTGAARAGYTVTWFRGPTNITSQVVAGTYAIDDLAAGGHVVIQARVRLGAAAPARSSTTRTLTITSAALGHVRDAVKATVTRA